MKQEKKAKAEINRDHELLEQKKQVIEYGNVLKYDPMIQCNVALLGFHSKFISASKSGHYGSIELKRDQIGANEVFVSIPKGTEDQTDSRMKVWFQLKGTTQYLSCGKSGALFLGEADGHHDRPKMWIVEKDEKEGTFSFKSEMQGTYLCAEKERVVANRKEKKEWEGWRMIVIRDEQPGSNAMVKGSPVKWILTSTDQSKKFEMQPPLTPKHGSLSGPNVVTVDENTKYQKVYGFGAAVQQHSLSLSLCSHLHFYSNIGCPI